jgi:hypothetical protein
MHELNNERYEFKKMRVVPKCFLIKPRQSDLNNYYTNNYLPYKGAAAWEIQVICYKSQQNLDLKE